MSSTAMVLSFPLELGELADRIQRMIQRITNRGLTIVQTLQGGFDRGPSAHREIFRDEISPEGMDARRRRYDVTIDSWCFAS